MGQLVVALDRSHKSNRIHPSSHNNHNRTGQHHDHGLHTHCKQTIRLHLRGKTCDTFFCICLRKGGSSSDGHREHNIWIESPADNQFDRTLPMDSGRHLYEVSGGRCCCARRWFHRTCSHRKTHQRSASHIQTLLREECKLTGNCRAGDRHNNSQLSMEILGTPNPSNHQRDQQQQPQPNTLPKLTSWRLDFVISCGTS